MADTREKQKLIELLEYCVDEYVEPDDPYDGLNVDYGNFADHIIADGWAKPEWISVKDRLPELHTRVICCGPKGGVFIAETRPCAGHVLWDDRQRIGKRNVTYWMPLPQPPKGE